MSLVSHLELCQYVKKNLPLGFDKSAVLHSKRQNHEEDLFQIMCASQKVRTLLVPFKEGNSSTVLWQFLKQNTSFANFRLLGSKIFSRKVLPQKSLDNKGSGSIRRTT